MPAVVYPYTVTNSYKGGLFMRTYSRNVRRAWDGEDYRPPKRQKLDEISAAQASRFFSTTNENVASAIDLEDTLERAIRETSVAALSSSPSRKNSTIFSLESQEDDNGSITITPPSSPPPTLQLTPPNIKARKPTFSVFDKTKKDKDKTKLMKRKYDELSNTTDSLTSGRDGSEPLAEILNSSSRAQTTASAFNDSSDRVNGTNSATQIARLGQSDFRAQSVAPKQNYIQTILDLGQPLTPTTCSQCSMSYTPSLPEDSQLHEMFHNRNSSGIALGKPFLRSAMKWCYEVPQIPGSVVVVDRKIALPARRVVQKVLELVNKELGSVDIKEEDLWSQRIPDGQEGEEARKCDRYKAFLHIIDGKCVGFCLAERISKAHHVLPNPANTQSLEVNNESRTEPASGTAQDTQKTDTDSATIRKPIMSSSISFSDEAYPALVGVSRIWTSKAFRRKGIANNLLDCVLTQFIYGLEIERSEVAFSQPTESGGHLARNWFGEDDGWAVYVES